MAYKGQTFEHSQPAKTGVLITNLGTPSAPTKQALKPYLKQFLSDPRIVEIPRLVWWCILNGIILNVRPAKSARSYASIWTEQGSPLAQYTAEQAQGLSRALSDQPPLMVRWAMRYGEPGIDRVLQEMMDAGVRRLLVLPLYPQYSAATTASTFDAVAADFTQRRWIPELRFVTQYFDHPHYIAAIANHIREYWQQNGRAQILLFSYHGVPLRYLLKGDPYHCQCLKTTRLIAETLDLNEGEYLTSFQSRFGRAQWLKPYTDEILKSLPANDVKSVHVVCPGFSSDCLETLEEIGTENRDYFLASGGENYGYIPALNSADDHIALLKTLVLEQTQGWLNQPGEDETELTQRTERAQRHPFNQKP